jgi:NADPH:quinone reductase-like Zn-dependent oxidoreductase
MVLDVIGGQILYRSVLLVRTGGVVVSIVEQPKTAPENGRAIFFIVEHDREQLIALERRLRDGRLSLAVGATLPLEEAPAAFQPGNRAGGRTIIRVRQD